MEEQMEISFVEMKDNIYNRQKRTLPLGKVLL